MKAVFFALNTEEAKYYYKKYNLYILLIDIFCFIGDLITVTWLYFNHFEYNSHGYKNNLSDNIQKSFCLLLSTLVIISLVLRYIYKQKMGNIKYILSLKSRIPSQTIKYKLLSYEIIIHCLQPYPGVNTNFGVVICGVYITYSLDMIFFALSLIRLYVVLKVIKYWNTYTNSRGQKIFEFFGNQRIWLFLYRTNLKINSFITLIIMFLLCLLLSAYLFKVFENYQITETQSPLGNIWNCFWFILQTITSVGLGDYVPDTLLGRLMAIIVSVIGLLLQSLLIISITLFISIADENTDKAYAEINLLHTKKELHNNYNIYFNNYIKYKFRRIKYNHNKTNDLQLIATQQIDKDKLFTFTPLDNENTFNIGNNLNNTTTNKLISFNVPSIKMNNYLLPSFQVPSPQQKLMQSNTKRNYHFIKHHNNNNHNNKHNHNHSNLQSVIDLNNKMKVIKEKHYLRIFASLKIPITISDFCEFAKNEWEPQMEDTIEWYEERNDTFKQFIDFMNDNIQSYQQEVFDCFDKNTQMLNLFLFVYLCGPIFPIEPSKQLRSDRIVKMKQMETKIKEFHVKHYEKRINIYDSGYDIDDNGKFIYTGFPQLFIDDLVVNLPSKKHEGITTMIYKDLESCYSDNSEHDAFIFEKESIDDNSDDESSQ